jgi:hypothetical protein
VNRADLQQLAIDRAEDARILLDNGRWTAAYYLGQDIAANPALGGFWGVVEAWTEVSRYEQKNENEARQLYEAVTQDPDGVFRWIQQHR